MRLKNKFRDQDDTTEHVCGPIWETFKFRDQDNTVEQV